MKDNCVPLRVRSPILVTNVSMLSSVLVRMYPFTVTNTSAPVGLTRYRDFISDNISYGKSLLRLISTVDKAVAIAGGLEVLSDGSDRFKKLMSYSVQNYNNAIFYLFN